MTQANHYRDWVQRVLAVHHARIELGLSRARECEDFVRQAAARLDTAGIAYRTRMTLDFDVQLTVGRGDAGRLKTLFADWTLAADGAGWVLSHPQKEWQQLRLVSEETE